MIKVIKSNERHHRDFGRLSTYWHFSFDDYYDPANMNWGALRVFNDDVIQPGHGFGAHPHRLLQFWVLPRMKGSKPRWAQRQFSLQDRSGTLLPVVSGGDIPDTLGIDQDATIYISALRAGQEVTHKSRTDRKGYLFVIAGSLTLNGIPLEAGDQARIAREPELTLGAVEDAELILLDLP